MLNLEIQRFTRQHMGIGIGFAKLNRRLTCLISYMSTIAWHNYICHNPPPPSPRRPVSNIPLQGIWKKHLKKDWLVTLFLFNPFSMSAYWKKIKQFFARHPPEWTPKKLSIYLKPYYGGHMKFTILAEGFLEYIVNSVFLDVQKQRKMLWKIVNCWTFFTLLIWSPWSKSNDIYNIRQIYSKVTSYHI